MNKVVRVGSRGSRLALVQAQWVIDQLSQDAAETSFQTCVVETSGDSGASRRAVGPQLGDGIFVKEIQRALLDGEVDLAVHSLKDVPTEPVKGLIVGAIPVRADPREAFVGGTLEGLPEGASVGTGSPRRSAQLKFKRPDLEIAPIRGNVPTRIDKVRDGDYDAVLLAAAGLERLGIAADEIVDPEVILPAPGQGALAIEIRENDSQLAGLLLRIHHAPTRNAAVAERVVLRELGGGCLLPVAALAQVTGGSLTLDVAVTDSKGKDQIRERLEGDAERPLAVGKAAARALLRRGARKMLEQ